MKKPEDGALVLVRRIMEAHPDDLAPSIVRLRASVRDHLDQRSKSEQLADLGRIAVLLGMYDAADALVVRVGG